MSDGSAIENGAASSDTTAGDFTNRSTRARRVGSASARSTASSSSKYLATHLTIGEATKSVNHQPCVEQSGELADERPLRERHRSYAMSEARAPSVRSERLADALVLHGVGEEVAEPLPFEPSFAQSLLPALIFPGGHRSPHATAPTSRHRVCLRWAVELAQGFRPSPPEGVSLKSVNPVIVCATRTSPAPSVCCRSAFGLGRRQRPLRPDLPRVGCSVTRAERPRMAVSGCSIVRGKVTPSAATA